jgi:hypothetical protein
MTERVQLDRLWQLTEVLDQLATFSGDPAFRLEQEAH